MMPALTREVMSALEPSERSLIDEVLNAAGELYNDTEATPNIEQLSDLVIAHWTNSGEPRFRSLEGRLRELILKCILAIDNPNLDNHCRFFEALKKRAFGLPCSVWIFTTNYDLLFETAAARTDVAIENGFCGGTERFFNPAQFRSTSGVIAAGRFSPTNGLTVKLIKLHGSISWVEESLKFYERHPAALAPVAKRVMVLPRRKKVIDSLTPPYDSLFAHASKVLGGECKYLVSCGLSFGDEHINQQLILPVVRANKCRLFALSQEEPAGIGAFKAFPSFQAGFENSRYIDGKTVVATTDLWKFSKFVSLF
jgi:SIR2-like protein